MKNIFLVLALLIGLNANASYVPTPYTTNEGGTGNISGTATINANMTGPITSVGNATSVASQTGTGSKFVMDTSPTLVTPNLGTPSAGVATNLTGTATALNIGGNAGSATVLQNPRTINGVTFDGSGNITIPSSNIVPADGGDAPYTIVTGYTHSSTTLTASRAYTLPACTGSNPGESHYVKNTASQTFNITLTANGSDTIDGNATFTVLPGVSVHVFCAANTKWELN